MLKSRKLLNDATYETRLTASISSEAQKTVDGPTYKLSYIAYIKNCAKLPNHTYNIEKDILVMYLFIKTYVN